MIFALVLFVAMSNSIPMMILYWILILSLEGDRSYSYGVPVLHNTDKSNNMVLKNKRVDFLFFQCFAESDLLI